MVAVAAICINFVQAEGQEVRVVASVRSRRPIVAVRPSTKERTAVEVAAARYVVGGVYEVGAGKVRINKSPELREIRQLPARGAD